MITHSLGNNDLLKDYEPPVGVAIKLFYEKIASILTPYIFPNGSITAKLNSISQFQRDFYSGGYYSLNVTGLYFQRSLLCIHCIRFINSLRNEKLLCIYNILYIGMSYFSYCFYFTFVIILRWCYGDGCKLKLLE